MKVLVCDKISEKGLAVFREDPEIEVDVKLKQTEDEICAIVDQYHGIVVRSDTKITKKILDKAEQLKVVGRAGVGIDNIDVQAATQKGVVVVNTPDGNTIAACEHTMAMMMALARHIPQADSSLRQGQWNRSKFVGVELRNKTLGIVGYGKIGTEVGKRSKAFGMKVLVYDPFVTQEVAKKAGVESVPLELLLSECDFITVHMPLTPETKHMIGAAQIAKMKDGVRLLNVARGGIIDEAALYEGIVSKKVAGAALDVYENEPQTQSPLFTLPEVIVTPHLGASTEEAQVNVAIDVAHEIVRVLHGIKAKVPTSTKVTYVKGCNVFNRDIDEIAKAKAAAARADVAVVVVGDNAWQTEGDQITSGEGYDVASLDLTGMQEELVRAVHATGTPTVVILVNGRPLSIRWIDAHVPAILETWVSGEQGGHAIADILFGDIDPGGRLSVTIPRHSGQLPAYYNHKKSKEYWINKGWGKAFVDLDSPHPLYPFGHGLSYTEYSYSSLRISPATIAAGETVHVAVDVENTGSRAGKEVVQLYIQDVVSSVSTPWIELKGFEKIELGPREKKTVTFVLTDKELSLLDRAMKRVVEPGEFKVWVGHSSRDIRLTGAFEVTE